MRLETTSFSFEDNMTRVRKDHECLIPSLRVIIGWFWGGIDSFFRGCGVSEYIVCVEGMWSSDTTEVVSTTSNPALRIPPIFSAQRPTPDVVLIPCIKDMVHW